MAAMNSLQTTNQQPMGQFDDMPIQGVDRPQNVIINPELQMTGGIPPPSLSGSISMSGGLTPPSLQSSILGDGPIPGPSVPGGGPIIAVRTDQEAMMMDGLMNPMGGRPLRRGFGRMGGGMGGMGPMMPITPRYNPMEVGGGGGGMSSSHAPITITKME